MTIWYIFLWIKHFKTLWIKGEDVGKRKGSSKDRGQGSRGIKTEAISRTRNTECKLKPL